MKALNKNPVVAFMLFFLLSASCTISHSEPEEISNHQYVDCFVKIIYKSRLKDLENAINKELNIDHKHFYVKDIKFACTPSLECAMIIFKRIEKSEKKLIIQ